MIYIIDRIHNLFHEFKETQITYIIYSINIKSKKLFIIETGGSVI